MTVSGRYLNRSGIWEFHVNASFSGGLLPRNQVWMNQESAVCNDAPELRQLQRGHTDFVSHRNRAHRGRLPSFQWPYQARALRRQFDPGAFTETEPSDVLIQIRSAHLHADVNRADVAGFGEHIRDRQYRVRMRVVNHSPEQSGDPVATIDHGSRRETGCF
jgi:hypothetical protein